MSIYIGIGKSKLAIPIEAGQEAAQNALTEIGGQRPNLAIVFASVRYQQRDLLKGIRSKLPDVMLIGSSSAGEITSDGPDKKSVIVMLIRSNNLKPYVTCAKNISVDGRKAARAMCEELMKSPIYNRHAFLMFIDSMSANSVDVLRGAQDVLGTSFPIVGGSSADDFLFKGVYQYFNDEVLTDSCCGVLLAGDITVGIGARHGWQPLGKPRLVTRSERNTVVEFDQKPAINIYRDYFGEYAQQLKTESLARMTLLYPLGIPIPAEDEYMLRNVLRAQDNGSLTYVSDMPEGCEVRLMMGSKERLIEAARLAAKQALIGMGKSKPKVAIIFDSAARAKLLGRLMVSEIEAVKEVLGRDAAIFGFYDYGEFAPLSSEIHLGKSHFHNETIVVITIGE